jgi:hypothetical protein|tara:strand:- start:238 stop:888 length:651 start_codon:yes stop_codon:yes gene_type:complete
MKQTLRINCKSTEDHIYIGRPSKWGNPWSHLNSKVAGTIKVATREISISKYRSWIMTGAGTPLLRNVNELRGNSLGCHCDYKEQCHGDTLVWLADMKKVAIIGSREFADYEFLIDKISEHFGDTPANRDFAVVSGGARGTDALAKRFGTGDTKHRIYIEHPADWDGKDKGAGMIRNTDIVNQADVVVAFWDGFSRGTRDSIRKAQIAKKTTIIYYI